MLIVSYLRTYGISNSYHTCMVVSALQPDQVNPYYPGQMGHIFSRSCGLLGHTKKSRLTQDYNTA